MRLVLCVSAWFCWLLLLGTLIVTQALQELDPDGTTLSNHSRILSRSIQNIEDPRHFPLQCGLADAQRSLVCDPDRYLSKNEYEFINNLLLPQNYGTEIIFVIIGSMDMSSTEDELGLTTADAAELFAGQLFDKFFTSSNDSVHHQALVFLSIQDRTIYFATGESLQSSISSKYIQEIVDSMRPFLKQNQYFNAIETCLVALQKRISASTTIAVGSEINKNNDVISQKALNDTSEVKKNETVAIFTDKSQENNPPNTFLENDDDNSDGDSHDDDDDGDGDDPNSIVFEYFQQQKTSAGLLNNRMVLGGLYGAMGFLTVRKVLSLFRRTSSSMQRPIQVTATMTPITPLKKVSHAPVNISAIASTSSHKQFSTRNNRKKNEKTVLLLRRLVNSDVATDSLNSDEAVTISDHIWESLIDPVDSHGFYRDESASSQHPLIVDLNDVILEQTSPVRTHSRSLPQHQQSFPSSRRLQQVRGQWTLARRMLKYVATPVENEDTHVPGSRDKIRSPSKHNDFTWNKNHNQPKRRKETKSSTFRTDGGVW